MTDFDPVAGEFERHRALPDVVTEQIREADLAVLGPARVCVLDLGAGAVRLGRAFVKAQIRYVGVDASYAMLNRFRLSAKGGNGVFGSLVQADGCRLPFGVNTFTAVLLAHLISASENWKELLIEACRVLDPGGFLVLAQRVGPANGIDSQLREQLKSILAGMGVEMPEAGKMKRDARTWLASVAKSQQHIVAAKWILDCSPRDFMYRHSTGARFRALPSAIKEKSMWVLRA